jgi:hypothetical protein
MNLYFQMLTQVQTIDALELLRFPLVFATDLEMKGNAVVSSGGKKSRFRFSSCEGLISKIGNKRFNQFEVRYAPEVFDIGLNDTPVISATAVFTPAATGDLWFSYRDWPTGGSRLERNRRMNAKGREEGIRYYGVKEPNLIEFVLVIESTREMDIVLDTLAKRITDRATFEFQKIQLFGCCDAGGPEFFVRMEAGVLMTEGIRILARVLPSQLPQLGARFDRLHPVMFGNRRLCQQIGMALGSDAKMPHGNSTLEFGVIRINSQCDLTSVAKRASEWLLLG